MEKGSLPGRRVASLVPEILEFSSISRFGKLPSSNVASFSRSFPSELPHRPQKQPQPPRVFGSGAKWKQRQQISVLRGTLAQVQAALKGTNLRGQTEPKRRFSQIFADSRLFPENKAFGKRRFSQKTADFRRKPQKTAGTRRKPQIGVCPLRFVPLSAALQVEPQQASRDPWSSANLFPSSWLCVRPSCHDMFSGASLVSPP